MLIKEIHIYGYGKFEQYSVKDIKQLQVIYGENEAGKSTIMSFIQSILFGFPLKQQNELRYEPKNHSKYGGQLVLEFPAIGTVRVERVKGKAAGDVTVLLQDGTRGGEELLQELLKGIDKSSYQSIFSFNIHGIQNVHKLTGEDLSRFLYSASAIGTDQLIEAEKTLQKEMENRFKQGGTKPPINVQLAKLKETEAKLNEAKAKIQSYEKLLAEIEAKNDLLEEKRQEIQNIDEQLMEMKEWNRIYPAIREKSQIKKQLNEFGNLPFPHNGLVQLEQLESELFNINKRLSPLLAQQEQITVELDSIQVDDRLIEHEEGIELMAGELAIHRHDEEQRKLLINQILNIDGEIKRLTSQIGLSITDDIVEQLDLSFARKEKIEGLTKKKEHLQEQKNELAQRERNIRIKLDELENFLNELKRSQLNPEERTRLQKVFASEQDRLAIEQERKWVIDKLNVFEQSAEKSNKNRTLKPLLLASALLAAAAIVLLVIGYWQTAIGSLIPALILAFYSLSNTNSNNNAADLYNSLQNRKRVLEDQLKKMEGFAADIKMAEQRLNQHDYVSKQIDIESVRYQQLKMQLEDIEKEIKSWKDYWSKIDRDLIEIGQTYFLSEHMARNHLLEAFLLLEKLKEKHIDKNKMQAELKLIDNKIQNREELLNRYEEIYRLPGSSYQEKVLYLKQLLSINNQKRQDFDERTKKLEDIKEQIFLFEKEERLIGERISELFKQSGSKTKEEFLDLGEKARVAKKLQEKLDLLEEQLSRTSFQITNEEIEQKGMFGERIFESLNEKKSQLKKDVEILESERASLLHEVSLIEEGGTYAELLHQFHQEKYELNEAAKEWAKYSLAKSILHKSMEKYKYTKLPEVLAVASKFFRILTNNQYKKIYTDSEKDELFTERFDGMIFIPNELSQATQEQLYISIRFALAEVMNKEGKYPLMIDDGFVNFDKKRLELMLKVLSELGSKQQILFFTCHESMKNYFNEESVLHLENGISSIQPLAVGS